MFEFLTDQPWGRYLEVAAYVVSGASALLLGVSKLTKNTVDDKWAARLVKVLKFFSLAPKELKDADDAE